MICCANKLFEDLDMSILKNLSFVALLVVSSNSYAEFSCSELINLRNNLDSVADNIDAADYFSREDVQGLSDIVDVIDLIASEENNYKLANAADRMEAARLREEDDAYVDALDQVADEIDTLYVNEC
jgi:hypothetical protein